MTKQTSHTIIGILFVLSGTLGLVYQIAWFKYLSLFLGNTTYAQTIVLATFMGGLALGAAIWGKRADRATNSLRLYAWLEIGIGAYCMAYPGLLSILQNVFVQVAQSLHLSMGGSGLLALKLLVSFFSLFLPTVLMGGTLPVLVRHISEKLDESGKNVAVLYFLNSLGAVGGAILGGFFLINILGLRDTVYASAVVNLLIGAVALVLSKRAYVEMQREHEVQEEESSVSQSVVRLAVVTAGVSGLAAMIYEVSWVRLLIPVLGSSTYSFSIMLVSFIAGIAIGSLIVSSLIQQVKDRLVALAFCQLGVAASLFLTLPMYTRVPFYLWHAAYLLNRTETTYPIFLLVQFSFVFIIMIVPTIFLGMTLPVASRIATRSIRVLGKSVGNVFSFNTVGTVIGSLGAGLVLIPLVGVHHTMEIGIACNGLMGLVILWRSEGSARITRTISATGVVVLAVAYLLLGGAWSRGIITSGIFRLISEDIPPAERFEEFQSAHESTKFFYFKEGASATVAVFEGQFQGKTQNVLVINGKADASSVGDLQTQVMLGQLPFLFQKEPQSALVIGLGSGVTAGSVLTHPVQRVDCVEISSEVIEASKFFDDVNYKPLQDPRFHLYTEDALAFLKLTPSTYDVIVSEPSNPWIVGIGNLYTVEFFQECKKKLNPGGSFLQWFHLYEMDDELVKLVLRTFQRVFPNVTVWQAQSADLMIMGTNGDLPLDYRVLENSMAQPRVREDLARIMMFNAATILSTQMLSSETVKEYASVGEVNTENFPRLEYNAPRVFFAHHGIQELPRFDERMNVGIPRLLLEKRIESRPLTEEELLSIGMLHTTSIRGSLTFGYTILSEYVDLHPKNVDALMNLAHAAEQMRRPEENIYFRKLIVDARPSDPDAIERYAWAKYSFERSRASVLNRLSTREYEQLFMKSVKLAADSVDRYRVRLADLYFGTQRYKEAGDNYRRALEIREKHSADFNIKQDLLLLQLAKCLLHTGQTGPALSYALQATQLNPKNEDAKNFIYAIWVGGARTTKTPGQPKL